MSAAARAKISAAQRARSAKTEGEGCQKKGKATQKKASGRKPMSAAMRKKLSAMMKARWAARKIRVKEELGKAGEIGLHATCPAQIMDIIRNLRDGRVERQLLFSAPYLKEHGVTMEKCQEMLLSFGERTSFHNPFRVDTHTLQGGAIGYRRNY